MAKVMLVEDDPTMFALLNTLFEIEGFEVASVSEDEDVLASIKRSDPDVILLDVHLRNGEKEINGFDLLKRIREDDEVKEKKVVMSSGIDFQDESVKEGADGFILKPYMPDVLINLIKSLVT